MARPKVENGFTRIANELLEAIAQANVSKSELRVLVALVRQSYGWQRKDAYVFEVKDVLCTMSDRTFREAVSGLVKSGHIWRKGKKLGIVKDYDLWIPPERVYANLPQNDVNLPESGKNEPKNDVNLPDWLRNLAAKPAS